jgi:hypothetical protein
MSAMGHKRTSGSEPPKTRPPTEAAMSGHGSSLTFAIKLEDSTDVRFGSKADMCSAKRDVRFTPNSDRKSGHAQMVMSALPPKADMCSATSDVG